MIRLMASVMTLLLLLAGCGGAEAPGPKAATGESMAETASIGDGGTEPLEEAEFEVIDLGQELTRDEERGLAIFRHYCAHCHGEYGAGDGQNSYGLEAEVRDLVGLELEGLRSDEELRQVISDGGAAHGFSTFMPPWGHTLQANRINDLVDVIRILPDLEPVDTDVEGDDLYMDLDAEEEDDTDYGDFSL